MYFPLFLKIDKINFLIIGAGNIALAKLETILDFTKNITVIAIESNLQIKYLASIGQINLIHDDYKIKYLKIK